jgi:hypothetical protein
MFFDLPMDENAAAKRYQDRLGYPPEYIFEFKGDLYLGPLRDPPALYKPRLSTCEEPDP